LKNILYKILLAVNAFFALTLLISYMAVHISPGDFAIPAFFGLAYPYLLLVNIILVVIWAMMLRFEAFISVVIIAIGFTHFSNYIKLFKPVGDKTNTFKVISYNVRLFNYFEKKNVTNSEKRIIEFLKTQKPDILCIQEFFGLGNPDEKEDTFREALGAKYYSHIKVLGRGKNRFYGIATFSKYPIIKKGEIIHPASSSLSIYTDIIIGSDTFRVYNNHLQSFRLQRMERSLIEELTLPENKEAMGEVKGLYVNLKNGFIRRALQSQVVKDNINRSPYPVIVTGDFNDTPVSYAYRKIRKGLNDSFVNSGYGAGFTYRGNYPPNRIDYILYNKILTNSYFEIVRIKFSDHYPIIAYFKKKN
jgi:endonuclease/exonuclease/phosphatase family metal-dependent hydrolase